MCCSPRRENKNENFLFAFLEKFEVEKCGDRKPPTDMSAGGLNIADSLDSAMATQMLLNILGIKGRAMDADRSDDATSVDSSGYSLNGKADISAMTDDTVIETTTKSRSDSEVDARNPFCQNIHFSGSEDDFSFPIFGNDVTVWCNPTVHTSGSSKVKINNIVNASWENRYYFGQQVVVNPTCEYVAYTLRMPRSLDHAIRVANFKTKRRCLLRGMKGTVVDLAFAHCVDDVLLSSVDEFGTLFIHSIRKLDDLELTVQELLTVRRNEAIACLYGRVVWCHYIPEDAAPDEEDDNGFVNEYDLSKRLAVINNTKAEVFNVEAVVKEHGGGPFNISDITSGYQLIEAHTLPISSATFSPDGTALATISSDGKVKFFQIYLNGNEEQRCLHEWNPHNGKALTCLFFLDDHSSTKPEAQFWKFAITGADMNRELKVWNCANWACLQTITFEVPKGQAPKPELKAGIDITASYLFLSDVRRNVLYVLNIYLDVDKNAAQISCASEFSLTSPVLSYAILSASRVKLRPIAEEDSVEEAFYGDSLVTEVDDDRKEVKDDDGEGVELKLIYVQPKCLQDCVITYRPSLSISNPAGSTASFSLDTISFKDRLSDLSYDACSSDVERAGGGSSTLAMMSNSVHDLSGQLLLPPESFTSKGISTNSSNGDSNNAFSADSGVPPDTEHDLMSHRDGTPVKIVVRPKQDTQTSTPTPMPEDGSVSSEPRSRTSSDNKGDGDDEDDETLVVSYDHVRRGIGTIVHSNGSSPSLEVQEILNKDLDKDMEFGNQNPQAHLSVSATTSLAAATDFNDLIGLSGHGLTYHASAKAKSLSPQPTFSDGETGFAAANHLVKWPTAPKMPVYGQRKRRTMRLSPKSANLSDANDTWTKNASVETSDLTAERYDFLARSVWELTQTIENQKCELQYLRQTVSELKAEVGDAVAGHGAANEEAQRTIQASLNMQIQKRRKEDNAAISNLIKNHDERLVSSLMQTVSGTVMTRLDAAIQTEFRNSILPNVIREVEVLKNTMHVELAQKLATTDSLMRENISRIAESKSITTSIAHAVASSLRDSTRSAFNETLQNVVVPSFEKSCQAMFHQVSDAFHKGSKEYTLNLEKSLEKQHRDGQTMITSQIRGVVENFQSITETILANVGEQMCTKLTETMSTFEDGLSQRFRSLVQKEMSVVIKEHQVAIGSTVANAIRSRAVTPLPQSPMDRSMQQAHILQLLNCGELNSAFQQALSASDLNLVMFVCDKVNPARVFGESPCPLQQPVLLSLIHQLAADLNSRTELKHDFLQEVLVIVDIDDPVTSSHVPAVMDALQMNLRQYIKNNPSSKLTRNFKVLLMAAESMLYRRTSALRSRPSANNSFAAYGESSPIDE